MYIQECRAGLERKDKEEIESLRNEVNNHIPILSFLVRSLNGSSKVY